MGVCVCVCVCVSCMLGDFCRLADKERVAAALENPALRNLINNGIVRHPAAGRNTWQEFVHASLGRGSSRINEGRTSEGTQRNMTT